MHHPRHVFFCRDPRDTPGTLGLNSVKVILATRIKGAHAIDHSGGTRHRCANARIITDIAEHWLDLSRRTISLHENCFIRATHSNPHTPALCGKPASDIAPYKARSAVDGHQIRHGSTPT